jgi:hypothetical protein
LRAGRFAGPEPPGDVVGEAIVPGVKDVSGAGWAMLSKTTSLGASREPPFIANTIAPMLASAMTAAAMSKGLRPLPDASGTGGWVIPAVGKETLPPAGVIPGATPIGGVAIRRSAPDGALPNAAASRGVPNSVF